MKNKAKVNQRRLATDPSIRPVASLLESGVTLGLSGQGLIVVAARRSVPRATMSVAERPIA
jgi:hypothetical protein